METLTATLVEKELSPYEIERNKPMPNLTHGLIQANLIVQLAIKYGTLYSIASEVALETLPTGSTPDIVIYPKRKMNLVSETAKQTEPPLVTIEIQSPSQSNEEMILKAYKYLEFGAKTSWIVYPAMRAVAVYSSPDHYEFFRDDETLKDSVVDIEVDLGKIFE